MTRYYAAVRELDPTPEQAERLRSAVGAVRKAQNWAIGFVKEQMEKGNKQSWTQFSLQNGWYENRDEVAPWHKENSKETYQYGCERAAAGLRNWSDSKRGKRKGKKVGFPKFRKRGHNDSVGFQSAFMRNCGGVVKIPRIGDVRMKEGLELADGTEITRVIVRERAGRWFASFRIKEDAWVAPGKAEIRKVVGVDAGIGDVFATLSINDCHEVENPRFYRNAEKKIARASRSVSRKQKGSKNRKKAVGRLARVHYRVASQRLDFIHKFTTNIVKSQDEIVIEDLSLTGMASRGGFRLGKSVTDVGWAEVRRQFEYKCEWYGKTLTVVSRWFPSSKMCNVCKSINKDLKLSDLVWACPTCGAVLNRNPNGALNLADGSSVAACGADVRLPLEEADCSEARSTKQLLSA